MVLSGALKEFILADVFNLLTQQKITGRLVLINGKRSGGIVFKDGIIVGAECCEENLPNKIFSYMVDVKRMRPDLLSQLFSAAAGNLGSLCSALTERGLLSSAELKTFAECCVEDMCCSLLMWSEGSYRFNSMRNVSAQACGLAAIPPENIIMEGMRRADEWVRMQEYIKEEMIFVPAGKKTAGSDRAAEIDPAVMPEEYILSLLNGSNTVKAIVKGCCLCEYKVYESINALIQSQRISALHHKYTQSIQAALKRKDAEEASVSGKTFFASILSGGIAAAIAAFFVFARFVLMPEMGIGVAQKEAARIPDAVESALLLHQAVSGEVANNRATLIEAKLLTGKDYKNRKN
jgi:hypothetical protein